MKAENCFFPADILLPKEGFEEWAVIACDQYTSEPEYWEDAEKIAADSPSALNLVLPEVYLSDDNSAKIREINSNMSKYLDEGVFKEYKNSLIYVERIQSDGRLRRGLVGVIDLECYDYRSGTDAFIRATEQTVISRIPPRVEIRKNAPLELPHVMLLIDDPQKNVIEPLEGLEDSEPLYDFTLMKNAGSIKGVRLSDAAAKKALAALDSLAEGCNGLLFSVGDGNHSLATAKECYEQNKTDKNRYALVELVNIHDEALEFEPIYRVVFGVDANGLIDAFVDSCGGEYSGEDAQRFRCVFGDSERQISVKPTAKLAVGTLQAFLDEYLKSSSAEIDYIHGISSLKKLCLKENTVGFIFDGMGKSELFPAVLQDGSLPRKTFSMGHADDKRFYIEARKIGK